MFMVDDMGWQDTSVPFATSRTPFNDTYTTPAMERLAAKGMKFTSAYACPVSSPTRVSLMTGMNAAAHRVTNWTLRYNTSQDGPSDTLLFPQWNMNGLTAVDTIPNAVYATTLPQQLRDNGYRTIHVGKAHFGAMTTPAADPLNIGFDVNIGGHAAGGPGSYWGERNYGNETAGSLTPPWGIPGLEKYHGTDTFLTEALTIEAKRELDEALESDHPFFLYMSHYAVHVPIHADSRYYQKYLDRGMDSTEAGYATLVEGMDKSLGDLMDYLDTKGIADNTIIIFMSDNGGLSAHGRGGEPNTHNRPLASGKGSFMEGGIREPMIVYWNGVTPAASTTDSRVIIEDFYPTILEMAGVEDYKTVQGIDGQSFAGIIRGSSAADPARPLVWHYPNDWGISGQGIGTGSAIRLGDFKLIHFYASGRTELYNVAEDLGEYHNLAADPRYATTKATLAAALTTYLKEHNAQLPSFKSSGRQCPYPDGSEI